MYFSFLFNHHQSSITPQSTSLLTDAIAIAIAIAMSTSALSDPVLNQILRRMFKIQGVDKRGRPLLQIFAASFHHRSVSVDGLKKYLGARVYPELENKQFSVLYVNTGVERCENFPGISALRAICEEAIPVGIKANIVDVYFLHPGLNSRLFLAAFGRLILGAELYGKIKYVSRVERLWEHVRRNGVELPEFVTEHDDEDLECKPVMDYGLESDHRRRVYDSHACMDSLIRTKMVVSEICR